jgi:hypothetical protein
MGVLLASRIIALCAVCPRGHTSPGPLTQTNEECDRRAIGRIERIVLWEKLCFGGIRCDEADGRAAHPKAVNFDFGPALRKRCGVFGPVTFVHANAGEAEHDRL